MSWRDASVRRLRSPPSAYLHAMTTNGVSIPPERARAAEAVAAVLAPGRRVALTTHVNADGDGVGSEVALWHLLTARGLRATIANPTPIPERFHFLLPAGADPPHPTPPAVESAAVGAGLAISGLSPLGGAARGGDPPPARGGREPPR